VEAGEDLCFGMGERSRLEVSAGFSQREILKSLEPSDRDRASTFPEVSVDTRIEHRVYPSDNRVRLGRPEDVGFLPQRSPVSVF
jgi:hypothetical protein